jgi:hypothetical protein
VAQFSGAVLNSSSSLVDAMQNGQSDNVQQFKFVWQQFV